MQVQWIFQKQTQHDNTQTHTYLLDVLSRANAHTHINLVLARPLVRNPKPCDFTAARNTYLQTLDHHSVPWRALNCDLGN